jgi:hypothetical protein
MLHSANGRIALIADGTFALQAPSLFAGFRWGGCPPRFKQRRFVSYNELLPDRQGFRVDLGWELTREGSVFPQKFDSYVNAFPI